MTELAAVEQARRAQALQARQRTRAQREEIQRVGPRPADGVTFGRGKRVARDER